MSVHTIGGLMPPPSEPAVPIVPQTDALVVGAKIQTQDSDRIRSGQSGHV